MTKNDALYWLVDDIKHRRQIDELFKRVLRLIFDTSKSFSQFVPSLSTLLLGFERLSEFIFLCNSMCKSCLNNCFIFVFTNFQLILPHKTKLIVNHELSQRENDYAETMSLIGNFL